MKSETVDGWRDLAKKILRVACVAGIVGIALKFAYYVIMINVYVALLPNNVYAVAVAEQFFFPYFPNALDSAFLIIAAVYLALEKRKDAKPKLTQVRQIAVADNHENSCATERRC